MSNPRRSPSLGESVHYQSFGTPGHEYESECRAAIITKAGPVGYASLIVFNPTGIFIHQELKHNEERAGGTWHWEH